MSDQADQVSLEDLQENTPNKNDSQQDTANTETDDSTLVNAAASETTPVVVLPKLGISLDGLKEFVEKCGGKTALQGLTTRQVFEVFVKDMTTNTVGSYCENQASINPSEFTQANVYVIHAWQNEFLSLFSALIDYFEDLMDENFQKPFIWIDIFSLDHNNPIPITESFLTEALPSLISEISYSLVVLSPFDELLSLQR